MLTDINVEGVDVKRAKDGQIERLDCGAVFGR